ncbi:MULTISPECIES: hypothetical protein [unclassified Streptomyces]|uniref:hypothetical protein n=1 Tax=unclassified Streptomyces TaxID=2593676 RepID=UPI0036E590CF
MTGSEFRKAHGDPATWTDQDYEEFPLYGTPGDPTPARELLARLAAAEAATSVEDRPDGSHVLHITPTPTAA